MKMYEKPVVEVLDDVAEVVCADGSNEAGSGNLTVCRFGEKDQNPGRDKCQACSATNGTSADKKHTYKSDFSGCVDNMPMKNS